MLSNAPYPTLEVYSKDDVLVAHYCMSADSSFKYRDLKNKSGVYLFINPELNTCYIGSAVSLHRRLVNHRSVLTKSIRHSTWINDFYSSVANLGGFKYMVWGIFIIEDNLLSKIDFGFPWLYTESKWSRKFYYIHTMDD